MQYITRTVKSSKGLSQQDALLALQSHPQFKPGTRIASIYNQGGYWVAKLMEPKTAFDLGKGLDTMTQPWQDLAQGVGDVAGEWASGAKNTLGEFASDTANNAGDLFQGNFGDIPGNAGDALGDYADNALDTWKNVGDAGMQTLDNVVDSEGKILDTYKNVGEGLMNAFDGNPNAGDQQTPGNFNPPKSFMSTSRTRVAADDLPVDDFDPTSKNEPNLDKLEGEPKHEENENKKLNEIEKKLDLLLDALGVQEKGKGPDVDSELPNTPKPKNSPSKEKSDPLPAGSGAKLKPGEVPNRPGQVPVGSPAFSSVRHATNGGPNASNAADSGMPGTGTSSGPVSPNALTDEEQVRRGMQTGTPSVGTQNITSFVASTIDRDRSLSIRQAKASIESELAQANQRNNFRVARIKRDGDNIHALVVRNHVG